MKPFPSPMSEDQKPFNHEEKELKYLPQPIYQDISASFIPGPMAQQPNPYFSVDPQHQQGIVFAQPVVQGVPVTSGDQHVAVQMNQNNIRARRMYWNYSRRAQNFICLNVCYVIILLISINSSFSDFKDYEDTCPNFAKANLFFAIVGIIWILFSITGVFAAAKKSEKLLKVYVGGLYAVLGLTIIITAYGLLSKDQDCQNDPPKTITLIGSALFTVFILGLFGYTVTKLRRMLLTVPRQPPGLPQRV